MARKQGYIWWTLRHEPRRVWFWFWHNRVPLTRAPRAAAHNIPSFDRVYYHDLIESKLQKPPRRRIFTSRKERKLKRLFNQGR